MITEVIPESWKELQDLTCRILKESGFSAETEVTVETVRGKVEIDVLATESVHGRKYQILVECKNWAARVPQNVVHGLRTVAGDIGANAGYIVSKSGFQSGAYEAAASSNVRLLNWLEFQEEFQDAWYWNFLVPWAREHLDPVTSYLEPLPAMAAWDHYLDTPDVERLKEMFAEHMYFGVLIMKLQGWMDLGRAGKRIPLPLSDTSTEYGSLPDAITHRIGYWELLVEMKKHADSILAEFQHYRDKAFARRDAEGKAKKMTSL